MELKVMPKPVEQKKATPLVQQTAYWGRVKQRQGCHARAFDIHLTEESGCCHGHQGCFRTNDDVLVVLRRINAQTQMAYVPYGPNMLPKYDDRGAFLEELSETIRPFLPENCLMIRYDLAWESPWADETGYFDKQLYWVGPPEPRVQEMRMNFATTNHNLRKAPTDILPVNTVFLDLKSDKELLLKQMKPKTRYNIRLAQRNGVAVHEVNSDNIGVWYNLYKETAQRNHIILQDINYFTSVLKTRANDSHSPAQVHLLLAEANGDALAGMFLVVSKNRATYLFGASSSKKRNLMPAYALQWEAIETAKKYGCTEYDMFGISPTPNPSHPMYGLYRFKTGFGGEIFHRQGCWDYPLDDAMYNNYRLAELNSQGFHTG
jgi:lipid II:glycine glycyltransferase (peptidoglycan interpeptide bridge formation enzyme)